VSEKFAVTLEKLIAERVPAVEIEAEKSTGVDTPDTDARKSCVPVVPSVATTWAWPFELVVTCTTPAVVTPTETVPPPVRTLNVTTAPGTRLPYESLT
jgi:hypothetical protein